MTVAEINLVVNGTILIGGAVYGFWFKKIVTHQITAKNATIETLQAVIKSKEAQVSALKDAAAPALVREHADMRAFANHVAEEKQRLSEDTQRLTLQLQEIRAKQNQKQLGPVHLLIAQVDGLNLALKVLDEGLGKKVFGTKAPMLSGMTIGEFFDAFLSTYRQILFEIVQRRTKISSMLPQ
jgi:hypothetical protein